MALVSSLNPQNDALAVVVLAGGKGTRMKSDLPKVLHKLAGREMILHVLTTVNQLAPQKVVVITGHEAERVESLVAGEFPETRFVRQTEQLGTAHAVIMAQAELEAFTGTVLVVYGDAPLVPLADLKNLLRTHVAENATVTEITTTVDNPAGFGRILRNTEGKYAQTVEEKDCTPEQRTITEVSTCLYAFSSPAIWPLLRQIDNNNAKREYYLTRIMPIAQAHGHTVGLLHSIAGLELLGANTPEELGHLESIYLQRKASSHVI